MHTSSFLFQPSANSFGNILTLCDDDDDDEDDPISIASEMVRFNLGMSRFCNIFDSWIINENNNKKIYYYKYSGHFFFFFSRLLLCGS